jgi:hypothetical protein
MYYVVSRYSKGYKRNYGLRELMKNDIISYYKRYKVKAIPLQAWTGPEGSRRLRLQEFMTIGTCR